MSCQFNAEIPWQSVREIVRIIRAGDVSAWPTALQEACCIGGCLGAMASSTGYGSPYAAEHSEKTIHELCDELCEAMETPDQEGYGGGRIVGLLMELVSKVFCWIKGD